MRRSTTVGTPSVLTPPCGFGRSTRRTGRGRYVPANSAAFTRGQCPLSQSLSSATVSPSTPGAPLFSTTRWYASHMLLRSTAASIKRSSPDFVRPDAAAPTSTPINEAAEFRPASPLWPPLRELLLLRFASRFVGPTLGVPCSGLRRHRLLRPLLTSGGTSRRLSTPAAPAARRQIFPGIGHAPHAYACRIYAAAFRASFGLCRYWPAYPTASPRIRFLFVRPALCLRLPPDSQSPATPLPFS